MNRIFPLLRWTGTPTGRRVLFAVTTLTTVLIACNPQLLPLLPVVDAVGLDVLALLLGAQAMAVLPWVGDQAGRGSRWICRALAGLLAGAIGGYLRQLCFGAVRGTIYFRPNRAQQDQI